MFRFSGQPETDKTRRNTEKPDFIAPEIFENERSENKPFIVEYFSILLIFTIYLLNRENP